MQKAQTAVLTSTSCDTLLVAVTPCVTEFAQLEEFIYRIADIIRGGQFSREGEPFVLQMIFACLKFADPTPTLCLASGPYSPRYVSRVYFSRMKLNRE